MSEPLERGQEDAFCLPKNVRDTVLVEVAGRYISTHPEQWHLSAYRIVRAAFGKAYPCH